MGLMISTDRMVSSSEARSRFGQLLKQVSNEEGGYFVILENGKVKAFLVHPEWLENQSAAQFPLLQDVRRSWVRNDDVIEQALEALDQMNPEDLPTLLR